VFFARSGRDREDRELIHDLRDRYTIVVVTHSMQQAARVSDYTAFFSKASSWSTISQDVIFTKPSDLEPRTTSRVASVDHAITHHA